MGSLDLMRQEIENQPEDLRSFAKKLFSVSKTKDPSELIFTGSGDSYSAALWAQELSGSKSIAFDPFELAQNPSRAEGKHVIILSVSGKTKSSLVLAKKVKPHARRRIAVTGSRDSPLTRMCDDTLTLEYRKTDRLTAGTGSYSAMLLACSSLLGKAPRLETLAKLSTGNPVHMGTVRKDSTVVLAGSGENLPLGVYGGLKVNEILGLKSIQCSPEQLVHAIIFSLDKVRDRIVLIDPTSSDRFQEIGRALSSAGFSVQTIDGNDPDPVVRSLDITFQLQHWAYNNAIFMGLKECAFLSNRESLDVSSRLIY